MRKAVSDRGAVSTEYALLAFFIAVVAAAAIAMLGGVVYDFFQKGLNDTHISGESDT